MDEKTKWFHCERKIRYRSAKSAQNAIKNIRKKGIIIPEGEAQIYKCKVCDGYHIGHKKKYKRKNK